MDFPRRGASAGRDTAARGDVGNPSAAAIGAPMLRYPHARTGHWLNWQSTGLHNRGLQVRVLRAPLLLPPSAAQRPSRAVLVAVRCAAARYPPAGCAGEVLWLHKSLPSF
ncbi:MAG: hypothetical protein QOJ35_466 [Solirubrobacteraceae bacterium]|nr:hypothetical protein [Solirubrobacteraceae bacterium]